MNIVMLGSGNVATHLGLALKQAGNNILQVWSRTESHALHLASKLDASAADSFDKIITDADLYIISVLDDAISGVASRLQLKKGILVHTSGTTGIEALNGSSSKTGVFYPLQTFSKQKTVDFATIPIAVQGSDRDTAETLLSLGKQISRNVFLADDKQRRAMHIAAVFACNFTNHFYTIAEEMLEQHKLDFDLVRPLIAETAAKAQAFSPRAVQTGPAVRGDEGTLKRHREFLKENSELLELYDKISTSIRKQSEI